MLRKPSVHRELFRVNITEKNGIALDGLDVHSGISKVGGPALGWQRTVHHHGGHTRPSFVWQSSAVAIAMRRVTVGLRIVHPTTKVLDRHEILLPKFVNIQSQHVVGIIVDTPTDAGNGISLFFLVPRNGNARLHGLAALRETRAPLAIRHRGTVECWSGCRFHRFTFVFVDKVLNDMDLAGGTLVFHVDRSWQRIGTTLPHFRKDIG
mmetsp:Transcript_23236/g.53935  ORF Transcript_23236/g.53935 Transcript_23236/m.53935 type:complete len:208 (-) Transcript_23236:757-1380(-)